MKYATKATRYLELATKEDRTEKENKELFKLGRALAAKGLDPRHAGLGERAIILDQKRLVKSYLKATEHGTCPIDLEKRMTNAGIKLDRRRLETVLGEIKTNVRASEKLRHSSKTRAPHKGEHLAELDMLTAISEDYDVDTDLLGYVEPASV